ncbi:MAG: DUF1738 domain-containing protein [Bacteroidetes bacterium]|nr:MAG: DUF1738 domain-containing protein [Bacteroidota bacterium]
MQNAVKKQATDTTRIDLYQEVTTKIISLLEQGVAPWRCSWNRYGMARNYATGHIYSGINAFLMNLTEHPIPYFMSFKQIKTKGGSLRKGAKSERVFFYKSYYKDETGQSITADEFTTLREKGEEVQRIAFLKYYRVFNIADVEGIELNIKEVELHPHEKIGNCESIVKGYPKGPQMVFEDANRAYYSPSIDKINVPDMAQFHSTEAYYCTLFHELTHSTGHTSRLNREGVTKLNPFGSPDYSKEELIVRRESVNIYT